MLKATFEGRRYFCTLTNFWSDLCTIYGCLFDITEWLQNPYRLMNWMDRKHSVLLCGIILLFVSSETNPRKTSMNARSISTTLSEIDTIKYQASTSKMIFLVSKTVTQNDFLFWYQPVTQFWDIDSVRLWVYEKKYLSQTASVCGYWQSAGRDVTWPTGYSGIWAYFPGEGPKIVS